MQQFGFTLAGEFVELNPLLKLVGLCDGGGVSVDGKVELRITCNIRAGQVVTLGGVRISVAG